MIEDGATSARRQARQTAAICLIAMLVAGFGAWWFLGGAESEPDTGRAPHPAMWLLTDLDSVAVSYSIAYHEGAKTDASGTIFTGGNLFLPTGARTMALLFRTSEPNQLVRWVILANADAVLTQPRSVARLGDIAVSLPGHQSDSQCGTFDTAQVLSGQLVTDSSGRGSVEVVGGVAESVSYPQAGERTAVNAIRIESPSPAGGPGVSGGCHLNLINWEQVGGRDWRTPLLSSGAVSIGDVPDGQFVESANPALTDTRSLRWQTAGPASISYTLFDTTVQSRHEVFVFLAGVLAALAATLLVEVIKAIPNCVRLVNLRIASPLTPPHGAPTPVDQDKHEKSAQVRSFLLGAIAGWTFRATVRSRRRRR